MIMLSMTCWCVSPGMRVCNYWDIYKDSDGPFPKNGFEHWRKALAYEGSRQVGFMRWLFESRPWHQLVPDPSIVASGQGQIPAAHANMSPHPKAVKAIGS